MGRGEQWVRKITDAADRSGEILPGMPLVELAGDRRILIECHGGILEYGKNRICVSMKYGTLCICGNCLEVAIMTREKLVITGTIHTLQIIRR